jgi:DNA-binding XRE family transcriptional regulator
MGHVYIFNMAVRRKHLPRIKETFLPIMKQNTRFKIARITSGLTQRALGERVGLPEHRITLLETGRAVPDADLKSKLAAVLGRPSYELFDQ